MKQSSTPTLDLVFFSPKKKLLESYQTKADTYGAESVYAKKSCFFLANKTAHVTTEL